MIACEILQWPELLVHPGCSWASSLSHSCLQWGTPAWFLPYKAVRRCPFFIIFQNETSFTQPDNRCQEYIHLYFVLICGKPKGFAGAISFTPVSLPHIIFSFSLPGSPHILFPFPASSTPSHPPANIPFTCPPTLARLIYLLFHLNFCPSGDIQ